MASTSRPIIFKNKTKKWNTTPKFKTMVKRAEVQNVSNGAPAIRLLAMNTSVKVTGTFLLQDRNL